MKKSVLAALTMVSISALSAAFVPGVIESDLKKSHPEFTVSAVGSASLCGVDVGYNYDGDQVLNNLKTVYGISSLNKQAKEFYKNDIEPKLVDEPEYPEEIDGYFWSKSANEKTIKTNVELKEDIQQFIDWGIDNKRDEEVYSFRKSSDLTFDQANKMQLDYISVRDEISEKNTSLRESMTKKFNESMIPKYTVASCLYKTEQYNSYINYDINNNLFMAEAKLSELKLKEILDLVVSTSKDRLEKSNFEFNSLSKYKYMDAALEIIKDGETVGLVFFGYGMFQDVYKLSIHYSIFDSEIEVPATYIYN